MQHLTIFGRTFYWDSGLVPDFVQHRMRYFTGKYGHNLDLPIGVPAWVRHKANFLMRKWGATN